MNTSWWVGWICNKTYEQDDLPRRLQDCSHDTSVLYSIKQGKLIAHTDVLEERHVTSETDFCCQSTEE